MKNTLPKKHSVLLWMLLLKGSQIQRHIADQVAVAMKDWAMSKLPTTLTGFSH